MIVTRALAGTALIAWTCCAAFCQSSAGRPQFEVASVKPAAPQTGNVFRTAMGADPSRVSYSGVPLRLVLMRAYGVKDYQISGPDWLDTERYEINATVPPGTPKDQVPLMLQSLLEDRFKLTLHRESKELPIYALLVGKNGPKLKESAPDDTASAAGDGPAAGGASGGRSMTFAVSGGEGAVKLPPGAAAAKGTWMRVGGGHVSVSKVSSGAIADLLARQLDRPVFDMTELKGVYDFTLDWTPEESQGMGPKQAERAGEGDAEMSAASTPESPSIFAAVQAQLGLKLEARKGPVEILVIDHAEKVPTEN